MTIKEPSNSYNYPLTTGSRGAIYYVINTDPNWTDIKKRKILFAKYGAGNVVPVSKDQLVQNVGNGLSLSALMAENYTPLSASLSGSVSLPVATNIGLNPPTRLSVVSTQTVSGTGMTSNVQITVSFNDSPGATSYDVQFSTAPLGVLPQAVTGLAVSATGTTINATWNLMPNASNYVLYAQNPTTIVYANAPVTTGSGSVVVPSAGSWILVVVPYNQLGIAGSAQSAPVTV